MPDTKVGPDAKSTAPVGNAPKPSTPAESGSKSGASAEHGAKTVVETVTAIVSKVAHLADSPRSQCDPKCEGSCNESGTTCLLNQPIEETVKKKEFKEQLHKWGHHHHLPEWAEEQLIKHVEHEIKRRKDNEEKFGVNLNNLTHPSKWADVWRHSHVHEGDIAFPKHAPHHPHHSSTMSPTRTPQLTPDATPKSAVTQPVADKTKSPTTNDNKEPEKEEERPKVSLGVFSQFTGDEALMTDELVLEIMEDREPDCPPDVIEKGGLVPVDPFALDVPKLRLRNDLFDLSNVHENTIRSLALCNPKPGDLQPGKVTLTTDKKITFAENMTLTDFDEEELDKNHGIFFSTEITLGDYQFKN